MGFIKQAASKLTGADIEADALQRGADEQANATRQAAESASKAAKEAAQQTATQQRESVARQAALSAAAEATGVAPETPTVNVADTVPSGAAKRRRQKFGIGSSSGVNI